MVDLRVVVVGGGLGGLCLAHGLRKAGVEVAVYERDPSPTARRDRYRLHIDPAGARSLHACLPASGWQQFLAAVGRAGGGFGFLDERLRELLVVEDALMYPGQHDPAQRAYPVERRALRAVLLADLADVVRFGRRFTEYTPRSGGGVVARFADGGQVEADVLVGADGAGSQVRAQLLPQGRPVDTGAIGIGLKLPLTEESRAWLPVRVQRGENLVMTGGSYFLFTSAFEPAAGDGYLLCAIVARRTACPPDLDALSGAQLQQAAGDLVGPAHPLLRRLVAEADPASAGLFVFAALPPPAPWPSGPVTVLGDAIHLMPPTGGIGANTALRDAHLLACRLAAAAAGRIGVPEAIAGYEEEMRDYGRAAVRSALATLQQGLSTGTWHRVGTRAFFRVCRAVPPLRRAAFRDTWAASARPRAWEQGADACTHTP